PADGFYEWLAPAGKKQPIHFRLRQGGPFAFAELWEHWQPPGEPTVESCAILTTEANDLVRPVQGAHAGHPRPGSLRRLARPRRCRFPLVCRTGRVENENIMRASPVACSHGLAFRPS